MAVLKEEIDSSTITIGNFNIPLSALLIMDRTTREKSNKEIEDLNNIIDQLKLADTQYSTQQQQNSCFSQVYLEHSPR